ncbi:macrocin O-methyltransferase [Trinickia dinghuensis]|uniref:Macrocin O-methyltransferase n=2 Tax=Trinickia dinghuensis TaxID=2291023 RepID=A0A3D8JUN8_9BURK|nr:macrocin O-methyltransferase [Trinickia dinghuensis]
MHQTSKRLTLCDDAKLDNVLELTLRLHEEDIPGDLIETGVWRGGMTIWMRALLRALGDNTRNVWVADSFSGLPAPDPTLDLRDAIWAHVMTSVQSLEASLDDVKEAFAYVGLLDERVRFLPGRFADTLPSAPISQLAMMRLDGDWYESTWDALDALYPKLVHGGYAIVDDYRLPTGCARAVDEYRSRHGIGAPLIDVDRQTVYWRKP